jgi:transposase
MSKDDYRRAPRRRFDAATKQRVLAACGEPGASIARVAQAHDINVNLLHKWRRQAQCGAGAATARAPREVFLPVAIAPTPAAQREDAREGDIRLEIKRGGAIVTVAWPVQAAAACAAWLRDVLR